MTTRAERMQQRIRGAGHGQVDDVSLHFDLGGDDTTDGGSPSSDASTPRAVPTRTPQQSVVRPSSSPVQPSTGVRTDQTQIRPPSIGPPDPYDLPERESGFGEATTPVQEPATRISGAGTRDDEEDDLALTVIAQANPGSAKSVASRRSLFIEEVAESPLRAPGTGQRRSIRAGNVSSSSAKLQHVIDAANEEDDDPISSPSEQRIGRIRLSMGGPRSSPLIAEVEEPDELSPEQTFQSWRTGNQASPDLSSPPKERTWAPESRIASPPPAPLEEQDNTLAVETSPLEVAKQLRVGKRRRSRTQAEAPDEAPAEPDDPSMEPVEETPGPSPKRRRRPEKTSPAKQKQGRRKAAAAPAASLDPAKCAKKRRSKQSGGDAGGDELVIFTQRYTKRKRAADGEGQEFSILSADIPFSNRAGVNCVDVLSSMFGEVIVSAMDALEETRTRVSDAASKREIQVKTRALEAFQAELRHRFLGHTIYVDHMHSLRQRIKQEKREKTELRDEILRLRSEREHVAIRKDAIREKHEKRRAETMSKLDLSAALHDVDLAIERGRSAQDLSPAQEKKADLANLELLLAQQSEQGSTKSDTGGTLKQLREFNAFLERAAAAMESR